MTTVPTFDSPEELEQLCDALASRLHFLNRVAIGESHFAWEVAEALRRLGRTFAAHLDDPATRAEFGDGCTTGTLPQEQHAQRLFELMRTSGP